MMVESVLHGHGAQSVSFNVITHLILLDEMSWYCVGIVEVCQ